MTEALLFVGIGSLLLIGIATLGISSLALQNARRYVELAEKRMEYLREGQTRLLMILLEERQSLKEELDYEREQHLVAQRRAEQASRERLPLLRAQRRLAEATREREEGWEFRTHRDAERRIAQLERELRELRKAQYDSEFEQASPSLFPKEPFEEKESSASSPETKPTGESSQGEKPRLAVWHPHPDDDVSPGRASAEQTRTPGDASVEMFRRHYDKYLENYEGYVKLAERIYRMRDDAEKTPGSSAEREWEERLSRVKDGIERTTARLDILEQYNPELATDDRISRRASIARNQLELERSRWGHRRP
jgi:hypothetical protein